MQVRLELDVVALTYLQWPDVLLTGTHDTRPIPSRSNRCMRTSTNKSIETSIGGTICSGLPSVSSYGKRSELIKVATKCIVALLNTIRNVDFERASILQNSKAGILSYHDAGKRCCLFVVRD